MPRNTKQTNPTQYDDAVDPEVEETDEPEGTHYVVKHGAIGVGQNGPRYSGEKFHENDYTPEQIRRLLSLEAIVPFDSDEGRRLHGLGDPQGLWNTPVAAVQPPSRIKQEEVAPTAAAQPVDETAKAETPSEG